MHILEQGSKGKVHFIIMFFFSSGSQCLHFSHEPSSLFHYSVLVDLSVSMMML